MQKIWIPLTKEYYLLNYFELGSLKLFKNRLGTTF